MHNNKTLSTRSDQKPEVITHYNSIKSGMDTLDQLVGTYVHLSTSDKSLANDFVLLYSRYVRSSRRYCMN